MLLTNYESLTMAAQFSDVTLPEKHQVELLVPLADGHYNCTVKQMFDPEREESAGHGETDFIIEVQKASAPLPAWQSIPWSSVDG